MQIEFHEKAIYLYIIGLIQLASKRVLSGSDCLKIDGGWDFAPDPTGGAYSAPPNPLAVLRGLTSKGWEGKEARRKGRGKGGKGELVRLGLSPPKVKFLVTSLPP